MTWLLVFHLIDIFRLLLKPSTSTRRRLAPERQKSPRSKSNSDSTHRRMYTNTFTDAFTHQDFYTQTLLHRDTFSGRRFYTQALLYADAFIHKSFYTQKLLHSDTFLRINACTQRFLQTDPFIHRRFYPDAFYTQMLLHTHTHTNFIHRGFYTQKLLESVSINYFTVLISNSSVFLIKYMMALSFVTNTCRHFISEVLLYVSFTIS